MSKFECDNTPLVKSITKRYRKNKTKQNIILLSKKN